LGGRPANERTQLIVVCSRFQRLLDAIYRTAQIAYDLEFDGITMAYSWPSNGSVLRYSADVENNQFTVESFKTFLKHLARKANVGVIHVIAHSMGNRAVATALYEIAISQSSHGRRIDNLILTAPDIDVDVFKHIAAVMANTARRTTLYASSKDKALLASKRKHKYPRAGDAKDIVVIEGIDSIDASRLDTDFLSHCYYGDHASVLCDVYQMMKHDAPPSRRFGLRGVPLTAPKYWEFRPTRS
jgi:esterase/lipase superfamily enzyme